MYYNQSTVRKMYNILLVEDDKNIREMLVEYFSKRDKEKFENAKKGKRRLIYYIDKKLFSKNRNIHNPFYDDKECYFTKSKMEEFLTKLNK